MIQPPIMVTGGCGFVGSALVRRLVEESHDEVVVLDDCSLGVPENLGSALSSVTLETADIRDRDAVTSVIREHRPRAVIHLAAIHFIPACDADPKRCIDVNVGGTQSVLDGCQSESVETVVLASTAAVYAPASVAHTDDSEIGPIDIYGLSKRWDEQLGYLFHQKSGIPVAVARLFNVFGPRETNPHLLPAIIRKAQTSDQLMLGNLSTRRDYVFVDDVARGLIALAAKASAHGWLTCNLGREEAVDGFELVRAVGAVIGTELKVITDPARLRASDRPLLLSDCTRAHSLLSWHAETSLTDGVRAAIDQPVAAGVHVD
jgi:UDP-glucose 4-epimerase